MFDISKLKIGDVLERIETESGYEGNGKGTQIQVIDEKLTCKIMIQSNINSFWKVGKTISAHAISNNFWIIEEPILQVSRIFSIE